MEKFISVLVEREVKTEEQNALHANNEMKNDNGQRIIIENDEQALTSSFVKFSSFEINFLDVMFNFLIKPKYCAKTKTFIKVK